MGAAVAVREPGTGRQGWHLLRSRSPQRFDSDPSR